MSKKKVTWRRQCQVFQRVIEALAEPLQYCRIILEDPQASPEALMTAQRISSKCELIAAQVKLRCGYTLGKLLAASASGSEAGPES